MTTRWNPDGDNHPHVVYAPRPARYQPGTWRLVTGRLAVAIGVIAAWTLLALILTRRV